MRGCDGMTPVLLTLICGVVVIGAGLVIALILAVIK